MVRPCTTEFLPLFLCSTWFAPNTYITIFKAVFVQDIDVSQDIVCLHQLSHFLPFETSHHVVWCEYRSNIHCQRGKQNVIASCLHKEWTLPYLLTVQKINDCEFNSPYSLKALTKQITTIAIQTRSICLWIANNLAWAKCGLLNLSSYGNCMPWLWKPTSQAVLTHWSLIPRTLQQFIWGGDPTQFCNFGIT